MPFEIFREPKGAYKRYFGHISAKEYLDSVMANQSDPDYDRMRYSINDFLGITGHSIQGDDVTKFAAFGIGAAYINPAIKIAIVTNDPQVRELASRFTHLTKYQLQFFDTLALARQWTGSTTASCN